MPGITPEQLAQVQARVDADPKVQAVIRNVRSGGGMRGTYPVEQVAGVTYMPPGYRIEARTGQVVPVTDFPKEQLIPWVGLGTLGAASALGALGGTANAGTSEAASMAVPEQGIDAIGKVLGTGGGGMDWLGLGLKAIAPAAATIGGLASRQKPIAPEIEQLLNQQLGRYQATGPLREQVTQQAFDRLPTSAKAGRSVPSLQSAMAGIGPMEEGDFAQGDNVRNLLREQMAQSNMQQPVQDAVLQLAQRRYPRR